MNFKTRYKSTNIKTRFVVFSFLFIGLLIILFFTDYLPWTSAKYASIGLGFVVYFYYFVKRYMYLEYKDDGDKVVFRYFLIIPSTLDHHAIEIPKISLYKFEIVESFFGLRKEIILIQKTKNGLAKYPKISLSILNEKQLTKLRNSLTQIINTNLKEL